jgi:hypothetical protein
MTLLLSGKEFNKIYSPTKFFKLTIQSELHNGYQFKTGLNQDTKRFNPTGSCQAGGIYFCSYDMIPKWINYNNKICVYYREVHIPDNAQVYIELDKFKADILVLSEKQYIWDNQDLIKKIIESIPLYIQCVDIQTEELCKLAISKDASALAFIKNQSDEICMMAILRSTVSLQYVKNQTNGICKIAIMIDSDVLQYVKDQTDELCELALRRKGSMLRFVKIQTEKLCKIAVASDGHALEFVKNQTDEICKIAVEQNAYALRYVINQTEELCKIAVAKDGQVLRYVNNETDEICKIADAWNEATQIERSSNFRYVRTCSSSDCIIL